MLLLPLLLLLLLLLNRLALLLLRGHLALLLLLRICLALLFLLNRLALLLLRISLTLLFLRRRLPLLLLFRKSLALLLLLIYLTLLLLRSRLIAHRRCRWSPHVAIGRKWLVDGHAGRAAMINVGKLSPVGAGSTFVLNLRTHGCSMWLAQRRQFRGSRSHLDTTCSAVEAYAGATPVVPANCAIVDVVRVGHVDVIDRAVVVEVAATPVTALVA